MYETIEFTHAHHHWQENLSRMARNSPFGKQVRGTTILTRNHEGLIEHIQLYHRPVQVVVEFARELAKRLEAESRSGCTE
jgi:hypothetical protein